MRYPPTVPRLTERYDVERFLAAGGMGRVWLARHQRTTLPVAIKVVHPVLSAEGLARMQAEVHLAATLDHPHIVPVLDQGVLTEVEAARLDAHPGTPWVAFGYVPGGDLSAEVGRWGWPRARALACQLLDAHAHAHGHGVLHLDVKPSNLLAEAGGPADAPRWLLADFSVARAVRDAAGGGGGTPGFMAPEQLAPQRVPVGPWSDLFGLGVTLSHLLAESTSLPFGVAEWLQDLTSPSPRDRLTAADARSALPAPDGLPRAVAVPVRLAPGDVAPTAPPTAAPQPARWLPGTLTPRAGITLPATWRVPGPARRPAAPVGLSGKRPLPPIGREALLDQAWAALSAVSGADRPSVLVWVGPPEAALGAVAAQLVASATAVGVYPVLRATLGGDTALPTLPELARGLHPDLPVLDALLARTGPRPWLLVLEDADVSPAGLALVRRLLAVPTPALVVVTVREGADWAEVGTRVDAGPLEPAAAARLLHEHFGIGRISARQLLARHGPWPLPLAEAVRRTWVEERWVERHDGYELVEPPAASPDGHAAPIDLIERARGHVGRREYAEAEDLLVRYPVTGRTEQLAHHSLRARLHWELRNVEQALAHAEHALALAEPGARDDDVAEAWRIRATSGSGRPGGTAGSRRRVPAVGAPGSPSTSAPRSCAGCEGPRTSTRPSAGSGARWTTAKGTQTSCRAYGSSSPPSPGSAETSLRRTPTSTRPATTERRWCSGQCSCGTSSGTRRRSPCVDARSSATSGLVGRRTTRTGARGCRGGRSAASSKRGRRSPPDWSGPFGAAGSPRRGRCTPCRSRQRWPSTTLRPRSPTSNGRRRRSSARGRATGTCCGCWRRRSASPSRRRQRWPRGSRCW